MYVVCEDHLEQALDEFVEIYESSPDLYLVSDIQAEGWDKPSTCNFCSKPPKYLVV